MFDTICILSPGLLGGSLLRAIRLRSLCKRLTCHARNAATRTQCETLCDAVYEHPEDATTKADLIIACAPVDIIPQLVARIAPTLKPGALITDVGSTKAHLCEVCTQALPNTVNFIGSHPMAGSEKQGLAHANAELFVNRPCILTPLASTPRNATSRLEHFWQTLGMHTHRMSPEAHDELVAHISHLPHLLAAMLCHSLSEKPTFWLPLSGQGLRDTTRVAGGDPSLWRAIFADNREALLGALATFKTHAETFEQALRTADWERLENLLETARHTRQTLG